MQTAHTPGELRRTDDGSLTAGDRHRLQQLADVADASTRSRAGIAGFVVGAALTLAAVLLVVQNLQSVPFEWLFFDANAPMWLLLLGSFIAGLIVGPLLIASARSARHRRRERRRLIEDVRPS